MDLLSRLLHRDGLMLVIDKPAGIPVHRGPKGGPSLEDAFDQLRFGLPRAPALAHRLDKDTSGCLVLGRHRKALDRLGKLFKTGRISKTYWAVVEGAPEDDAGEIDLALGRLDATRGWWMQPDPMGLPSRTGWRVLGRAPEAGLSFIEFTPHTGRTHQIRVHAQAMGWPILGDPIYGSGRREGAPPLHLHARAITIPMQDSKEPVRAEAPAPAHMLEAMAACGWPKDSNASATMAPELLNQPEAFNITE
ncbi:RluA family pseudouridine synthase [Methylocystis sp. Sn-Cys]|uniref:RluA family pseudouridine synthase n=1 Tax=Methylocystis sp. Sn-Cys TaxID=1701263 RepID=UPI001923E54F|nr:RNA pseudouridine synthase [Methylocystis sp. Sn-Cys]MBL1257414.1 RNA pseudouridine synthase [Methylocystis sp. Sn-Cys]